MSDFKKIMTDLKGGKYQPVYFLMGEEPYYIDAISSYIEKNVLNEMEKEFNLSILYGIDVDLPTVVAEAKRFPMMGQYTVVIVKEAQNIRGLLKAKVEEETKEEKGEEEKKGKTNILGAYVENPQPQTILVFCCKYKNLDKRTALYKSLQKKAVVFESKKIYADKVPGWIEEFLSPYGYKIEPRASLMVSEYLGNDLSKVANELEKMMINLAKGSEITAAMVQANIGISKDYNPFELNEAISRKDVLKANRIVNYFGANPRENPMLLTVATLFSHFNKILTYHCLDNKSRDSAARELGVHPFFIKDYEVAAKNYSISKVNSIVGYLREYDLKSKGFDRGDCTEGDLLKELVFKIMH
jgi:DNA polymerase III subunit delta